MPINIVHGLPRLRIRPYTDAEWNDPNIPHVVMTDGSKIWDPDIYDSIIDQDQNWFDAIEEPLQAVLDIGVGKRTALVQCNEVLKIVADSYADMLACPCRCDVSALRYLARSDGCQFLQLLTSYAFLSDCFV